MEKTTGVYPKLINPAFPWDEKIYLAKLAWSSADCVIPNKQQVLLDWACQELISGNRNDSRFQGCPPDYVKGLWEYLVTILESSNSSSETQGIQISITIKPQLLSVFTDVFSQQTRTNTGSPLKKNGKCNVPIQHVIKCCQVIVTSPQLSSSLFTKFENYVLFLSSVLSAFVVFHRNVELFSLVEMCLRKYIPLQRRQTNHKKLFERICEHLIKPMLLVRYALNNKRNKEERFRVHSLIHKALSDALFRRDHVSEYPLALKALKDERTKQQDCPEGPACKRSRLGSYPKQLFDTLKVLLQDKQDSEGELVSISVAIMDSFPQLFKDFLNSRRANQQITSPFEFEFFSELCYLLGIRFNGPDTRPLTNVLPLVHDMLTTLHTYNVYQVAEDNDNGAVHLKWFLSLTELLLKTPSSCKTFECLEILLQLSHHTIEPHLSTILLQFWSDDVLAEEAMLFSRDVFISSVVRTYSKLRQIDKFFCVLLTSLRSAGHIHHTWTGLPPYFFEEIKKVSQALPFGLATSVWKIFCDEIQNNYLPPLVKQSTAKNDDSMTSATHLVSCMERTIAVFRVFILHTSFGGVAEHRKTDATIKTLSSLYYRTVCDVLRPLLDLYLNFTSKQCNSTLRVSSMVLFHTLRELRLFLSRFKLLSSEHEANDSLAVDLEKSLKSFKEQGSRDCDRLRYVTGLLCMQDIRIRLLEGRVDDELNKLIAIISDSIVEGPPSNLTWNGQMWSVDKTNFTVAQWHLVCTHAVVVLPLCSLQQQLSIAHFLLDSLADNPTLPPAKCTQDGFFTVSSISRTLIQSSDFHEVASMQTAIMSSLWQKIGSSFSPSSHAVERELLGVITAVGTLNVEHENSSLTPSKHQGKDEDIEEMETSEEESVSSSDGELETDDVPHLRKPQFPAVISSLLPLGGTVTNALRKLCEVKSETILPLENAKELGHRFEFLALLPLDWLTDVNHVGCVLGLLACDAMIQKSLKQEACAELLKVSSLCRRLLTVILKGCVSRKRFLIQHTLDMDTLLSWLLLSILDLKKFQIEYADHLSLSMALLCAVIRLPLKIASQDVTIGGFVKTLCEHLKTSTNELQDCSKKVLLKSVEKHDLVLKTCGSVMLVFEEVIACKTSRLNEVKMAAVLVCSLAPSILEFLQAVTERSKDEKKKHERSSLETGSCEGGIASVLVQIPVIIDSYTSVLHIYRISQTSRKLSRTKEVFHQWHWQQIFPFILVFTVKAIQEHAQIRHGIPGDSPMAGRDSCTKSCLRFLRVLSSSLVVLGLDVSKGFHSRLLASVLHFLSTFANDKNLPEENDMETKTNILREEALGVVLALLQGSESEIVAVLLQGLVDELGTSNLQTDSCHRLATALQVWSLLLTGKFTKERKKELRPVLPQVLMAMQSVLQQLKASQPSLVILVVNVMVKILSLGTSMVQTHHASLVFHGSLLIDLTDTGDQFPAMFQSQYSLLSAVLFHQTEAVYGSVHVFVTCVRNILKSLLRYGNDSADQDIDKEEGHIDTQRHSTHVKREHGDQLKCAHKMTRLYQEIATHKLTFSKYSPYMIAEYIQGIQEVSLPSQIKEALTCGVYCLLDLCGEHELALLYAVLDKGSRELFKSLHADYTKYHKFKGKV